MPKKSKQKLIRTAKGKRPQYFQDPAVDKLHGMIMTLIEELSVTRDRADTLERLLTEKGIMNPSEIDKFEPDQEATAARRQRREEYIRRVMKTFNDEVAQLDREDQPLEFDEVIKIVDQ